MNLKAFKRSMTPPTATPENREPECRQVIVHAGPEWNEREEPCFMCAAIRAAYQRGREDAAKAVEAVHSWEQFYEGAWVCSLTEAAAAARGERPMDDEIASVWGNNERGESAE